MADEAPRTTLCLHKESRVDFGADPEACLIQIQIPSTSTFSRGARNQRRVLRGIECPKDEKTFQKTQLAASSSTSFRSSAQAPKSVLWRLLDEDKVLEIRPVDLTKGGEEHDATCILQFHFTAEIHREAVALTNGANDNIQVYALTKGNDLYTLALRPSFFQHEAASENNVERWCKAYRPASFTMCTPHRLIVADATQVIISLSDGRLLRLTRKDGEDGTQWQERAFNDGRWGSSLRGLVRWQGNNTIRFDGSTLDQATALAGALSPDGSHVYTVCINHTLKVWELETGKCVFARDLLGVHREPRELPELMLDPGSTNLIRIFDVRGVVEGDEYYVMTYSPHDVGQFKIWAIRDANSGDAGVRDLYPDEVLRPIDPELNPDSKSVWRVSDFSLGIVDRGNCMDLWILMKSNRRYRVFHLAFDLGFFPSSLPSDWQKLWTTVAQETGRHRVEPQSSGGESEDVNDQWLKFLFYPGIYSTIVLETALSMYQSSRNWIPAPKPKTSLRDRLCHATSSDIKPERFKDHADPHQQYRSALHQEWCILWQDIQDVERQLWEVVSLAYDEGQQLSWLVFAGGCAAIRTCDQIERMAQNTPDDLAKSANLLPLPSIEEGHSQDAVKLPDELAVIINAAAGFRRSFSHILQCLIRDMLSLELWQEPTLSMPDRIQRFYDQCSFDNEISDNAFEGLNEALVQIGGFNGLENGQFEAILMALPSTMASAPSGLTWTNFGSKLFDRATRECIGMQRQLVLDLLFVVVFLTVEVDEEGNPLATFDAPQLYSSLLERAKEYEVIHWLSTQSRRQIPSVTVNNTSSGSVTILEALFSRDISPQESTSQSQSEALTNTIGDVLTYINGRSQDAPFDEAILMVQCDLLAKGSLDLAVDFAKFVPDTAWGTYIKGRMYLMQGTFDMASTAFKKSAWKLSRPSDFDYADASAGLLPLGFDSFGHGLSEYYTHIASLHAIPPSYVASFASLGLQSLPIPLTSHDENDSHDHQRTSLLKTLFTACLHISDFDPAFTALTRLPTVQAHELIPDFVETMISAGSFPRLLSYAWLPNLSDVVDAYLAGKAATYTPFPTTSYSSSAIKSARPGPSSAAVAASASQQSTIQPLFPPSQSSHPSLEPPSSVNSLSPNYPHLLASYRISRSEHRGAAAILIAYLLRLQKLEKSLASRSKPQTRAGAGGSSQSQQTGNMLAQGRKLLFARQPPTTRHEPGLPVSAPSPSSSSSSAPAPSRDFYSGHDDGNGASTAFTTAAIAANTTTLFETHIEPTYLFAINALLCAGDADDEDETWVFVGGGGGGGGGDATTSRPSVPDPADATKNGKKGKTTAGGAGGGGAGRRKVVTLKDVRGWYKDELDRRSLLERGRWGFGADGAGAGETGVGDGDDNDDDDDDGGDDDGDDDSDSDGDGDEEMG